MTATLTIQEAIARSQSHNEIVPVRMEARGIKEAMPQVIAAFPGGEVDWSETNTANTYDVWGYTLDMPEGQMAWRISLEIATPAGIKSFHFSCDDASGTIQAHDVDEAARKWIGKRAPNIETAEQLVRWYEQGDGWCKITQNW